MSIRFFYDKWANCGIGIAFLLLLLAGPTAHAQSAKVSGTVLDEAGMSIPGVNINEKGTDNYTMTDLDGNFTITVAGAKSELVFTYMGFETITQAVGDKKQLNVIMKPSVSQLEEVVVIGYGTAKKSDLTGAVSTISGSELSKLAMPNVAETLTGRLAGVQVRSSEGAPDAEIQIRVRGGGSLTQDSSPLLIVDGFPVNSINDIAPSDIENITVLKDASSTAIYGSRGANGVIIITTKSGTKDNKLAVTFNMFSGAKFIAKKIGVLGVQDYADWQYEYAMITDDQASYDDVFGPWQPNQFAGVQGTDWQEEIYGQMGITHSYDLGLRGGSDKLNYSFSYARFDEQAIMLGSDYRRNNITLNLKSKVSEKVNLGFTLRYSDTEINGGGANDQNEFSSADARLRHSVGYAPIPLPGITDNDVDEAQSSYLTNPFIAVADNDRQQRRKNFNMLGNFSWKIVKDLQFRSDFGLDNYNYTDNRFYGRTTYYVRNIPLPENQGLPALIMRDRKDVRFRNTNTLTYDLKKLLGDDHGLTLLAGQELINTKITTGTNTVHAFPALFTFDDSVNLSSQGKPFSIDNFVNPQDKLLSFFGRLNYDYKDRYLLTATFRADGSSKFNDNNRWGYFPSAAAAWKISSENFLKDVSWLNLLKLRLSYGQAGNNNIPTGQTIQTFQSNISAWINGVSNYLSPSKYMFNPDLKWETTTTRNLGLDYELFKGRITGSFDIYKNTTSDLLVSFPVSGSGYDFQYRNMGEIENKGFETTITAIILDKKDYGLSVSFNMGYNQNEIKSLGIMNDFEYSTKWASSAINGEYLVAVGQALGTMYGYQSAGRYEVSDFTFSNGTYTLNPGVADASGVVGNVQPGSMKLKDLNGDGVVDAKDRTIIGHANPKHSGGFVINANAYGFDLSAAFNYSYGNDVYNANKIEFNTTTPTSPTGQYRNLGSEMAAGNRWTNINPATGEVVTDPAQLEALNANTTMWSPAMQRFVFSDWAVEDGSFLRLNTLTLGYTLPQSTVAKLGLSRLRIYGTANNVFVWTNYSGPDPEVSTRRDTPLSPGVDYSAYPRSRQFVFGLNLNF